MTGAGRPRRDGAPQVQAVGTAAAPARRAPIHDHPDPCPDGDAPEADRSELRDITRYL